MARPMFTVNITHLNAAQSVISAGGFRDASGPEIEKAVVAMATTFRAKVRQEAPLGKGRLSQYQRKARKGHGTFKKSVAISSRRGGWNTTSRVKTGPIGNILRAGAKPHDIKPFHGLYLRIGDIYVFGAIHHPGFRKNDFWKRATDSLEGQIRPTVATVGLATADKMAARIAAKAA